ncbi:30S ribosomal protein S8 [Candidatus Giovannonibacteria bacterium RIFCSPHIGHO2_01_FULL_45_33]|uniref:Small ribosomal subunit protein uS8 n=1 Tax=Candidatus Giovannonibacteria bacterium RIFCSPLOWO2_01_FULL_45_34 TaxID=1798351 RepID=A0A1F5X052_9BACT|nr:MAG: 30S ribosomal protein S8 [Candidatus Giovannonibacteria bacterium RIFCSPHIGHO2_01_FULL_45_33]OGF69309.1 MAG: 30S ribosomal protein S8 [Candidatus Giovannonibacteria bacterium RIFCSPHIGHO2_02_FULL_44_11]OGF81275.1 MAG: 30S ribosomal protein S8 [Candidatus Giovannonibacteria bacterium RIFCSPLOWO2_01_FULL_45_34]
MTDPISDMLIRIKNAQAVKKETVSFAHSKLKNEIAKILESRGYIGAAENHGKKQKKLIEVALIYGTDGAPKISGIRRISKPSRRVYRGVGEIFSVKNGLGTAVYSTTRGLLTDREARKQKVGGEILFEIW